MIDTGTVQKAAQKVPQNGIDPSRLLTRATRPLNQCRKLLKLPPLFVPLKEMLPTFSQCVRATAHMRTLHHNHILVYLINSLLKLLKLLKLPVHGARGHKGAEGTEAAGTDGFELHCDCGVLVNYTYC